MSSLLTPETPLRPPSICGVATRVHPNAVPVCHQWPFIIYDSDSPHVLRWCAQTEHNVLQLPKSISPALPFQCQVIGHMRLELSHTLPTTRCHHPRRHRYLRGGRYRSWAIPTGATRSKRSTDDRPKRSRPRIRIAASWRKYYAFKQRQWRCPSSTSHQKPKTQKKRLTTDSFFGISERNKAPSKILTEASNNS